MLLLPPSRTWRFAALASVALTLMLLIFSGSTPGNPQVLNWRNSASPGLAVNNQANSRLNGAHSAPYGSSKFAGAGLENYKKPEGLRLGAMVMAGRSEFVTILDCYLRRNLVSRGGWLDEVNWIIRTDKPHDIAYLDRITSEEPEYVKYVAETVTEREYQHAYDFVRNDTVYIKIDDDVVFWEDHAIPAIVKRLMENPEYAVVSANVVNQPALSWVHYHLGVQKAYLPELEPPPDYVADETNMNVNWRASLLPKWSGTKDQIKMIDENLAAPFKNHRWLPVDNIDIEQTPVGILGEGANYEYRSNNSGWHSWAIAAQTHYSFFENLEKEELWKYKFDVWDYHYDRLSINFLAFHGSDLVAHPVHGSDEHYLTITMPKLLKRHAVLDGTALVVHFGFHRQVYGHGGVKGRALNDTDALWRYRNYAQENICGKTMPYLY